MKSPHLLVLIFCFFKPFATIAKPIKGISDFEGGFKVTERIDFECPPNDAIKISKPNENLYNNEPSPTCWVDFYPTYLNVMDKQVINRSDIIRFFQSPPASGKCCASWNLIYRDNEGKTAMLSMRRKDLPFPLTKRKLKRLGTPANILNRWLAQ